MGQYNLWPGMNGKDFLIKTAGKGIRNHFIGFILKNPPVAQEKLLERIKQTRHHFLLLLKCLRNVHDGCLAKELNFNLIAYSVHLLDKNNRFFKPYLSFNEAYFFLVLQIQITTVIQALFVPTWLRYPPGPLRSSNNSDLNQLPAYRSNPP